MPPVSQPGQTKCTDDCCRAVGGNSWPCMTSFNQLTKPKSITLLQRIICWVLAGHALHRHQDQICSWQRKRKPGWRGFYRAVSLCCAHLYSTCSECSCWKWAQRGTSGDLWGGSEWDLWGPLGDLRGARPGLLRLEWGSLQSGVVACIVVAKLKDDLRKTIFSLSLLFFYVCIYSL